jgi:hypothetical protein
VSEALTPFLVFTPIILAVFASVAFGRVVSRRVLFFVASTFTMLELQGIIAPSVIFTFMSTNISQATTQQGFSHSLWVSALLQTFVGLPFLCWLANGLRNPNPSFKRDA